MFDPKINKKRDEPGSPTNEDRERKRPFEMHNHGNQPVQIKCSREFYNSKVKPIIKQGKESGIELPKNEEGKHECLTYCLVGECNSKCFRRKQHIPVKQNSNRFKQLLEFKKKAAKAGKNGDAQDFE